MIVLFGLGDGCSAPANIVGVQDYGRITGRVLDAMTNRPIPNALLSVGSIYTTQADVNGAFALRTVTGDQTIAARAAGYGTTTSDVTVDKDATVSVGYLRLVPLVHATGQATLPPPPTPSPAPSVPPTSVAAPASTAGASPAASPLPSAPVSSPTATP